MNKIGSIFQLARRFRVARQLKARAGVRLAAQHSLLRALQAHQCDLEKELLRRNQALLEASIVAAEATRARRDLLTRMGHDLRAPLTTIMGYADLVACSVSQFQPPGSGIERSSRKMLMLIDGFMACVRGSVMTEPLMLQPVELRAFLLAIAGSASTAAKKNSHRFDCRVAKELPDVVELDSKRLRQVLEHLLANAIHFTSGGDIQLSADLLPCAGAPGDGRLTVVLTVRDSGPGLPLAQAATLLEPWRRPTDGPSLASLGLGLLVTHLWVLRLGGRIEVLTAPGQGTAVRVIIALKSSSLDDAALPLRRAGLYAWVVDDSAAVRRQLGERLGERLERQGLAWLALPCGQAALNRMGQPGEQLPHLIQTNLKMPGTDGRAVLEAEPAVGHGFSALLAKPLSPALLHRILKRLLRIGPSPQIDG